MTDSEIYSKVDEMRRYLREDEEVLANVLDVLAGRTSPHLKIQPPRDPDPLKGQTFRAWRPPEGNDGEDRRSEGTGTVLDRVWGDVYLIQFHGSTVKELYRLSLMQHWEFSDPE